MSRQKQIWRASQPAQRRGGSGRRSLPKETSDILDRSSRPFVLILDGVQDPHNLGAILRSAQKVLGWIHNALRDRAVGITEVVSMISVGAADHVPFMGYQSGPDHG